MQFHQLNFSFQAHCRGVAGWNTAEVKVILGPQIRPGTLRHCPETIVIADRLAQNECFEGWFAAGALCSSSNHGSVADTAYAVEGAHGSHLVLSACGCHITSLPQPERCVLCHLQQGVVDEATRNMEQPPVDLLLGTVPEFRRVAMQGVYDHSRAAFIGPRPLRYALVSCLMVRRVGLVHSPSWPPGALTGWCS